MKEGGLPELPGSSAGLARKSEPGGECKTGTANLSLFS